jgi:Uma2 family endonuclease
MISHRFTQKNIAMGLPAHQATFTAENHRAWEPTQRDRHEYLDGEVLAMAGAEDRHVTVVGNLCIALRQHFNSYFYPDVVEP